jgi:hypothetical protein
MKARMRTMVAEIDAVITPKLTDIELRSMQGASERQMHLLHRERQEILEHRLRMIDYVVMPFATSAGCLSPRITPRAEEA